MRSSPCSYRQGFRPGPGREETGSWLTGFFVSPHPPPEISLNGLKRLDPHFPNVVWAASRACSGCQGMF